MTEDNDPYRCPVCDTSALRSEDVPTGRQPGPYRIGYKGPWFACRTHGVVVPCYDQRRAGRLACAATGGPEDYYYGLMSQYEPAVDILTRFVAACPDSSCALCVEANEYLAPVLADRAEEAAEDHCRHERGKGHGLPRDGKGRCAVCGCYWQRVDGIWFTGGRGATEDVKHDPE
jgi:hypothetical protein